MVCFQPFQPFQSTEKVPDRVGACGDGKVQPQHAEECDDGNQIVTDACLSELHASLTQSYDTGVIPFNVAGHKQQELRQNTEHVFLENNRREIFLRLKAGKTFAVAARPSCVISHCVLGVPQSFPTVHHRV